MNEAQPPWQIDRFNCKSSMMGFKSKQFKVVFKGTLFHFNTLDFIEYVDGRAV